MKLAMQKTKKGERFLPKINYICIAYVQTFDFGTKVRNLSNAAKEYAPKDIAESIGVSPSTITRELKRNSVSHGKYNWITALENAEYHKRRKLGNHAIKDNLKSEVVTLLTTEQWSPEQISGRLARDGKNVSYETIYKIIRRDKANGGDLYKNCRHRLKHRSRPVGSDRVKIPNRTSIHDRPEEADGKRFGEREGLSVSTACDLFGHCRQAYYQQKKDGDEEPRRESRMLAAISEIFCALFAP